MIVPLIALDLFACSRYRCRLTRQACLQRQEREALNVRRARGDAPPARAGSEARQNAALGRHYQCTPDCPQGQETWRVVAGDSPDQGVVQLRVLPTIKEEPVPETKPKAAPKPTPNRTCEECGKHFHQAGGRRAKVCGEACRKVRHSRRGQLAWPKKKAAAKPEAPSPSPKKTNGDQAQAPAPRDASLEVRTLLGHATPGDLDVSRWPGWVLFECTAYVRERTDG